MFRFFVLNLSLSLAAVWLFTSRAEAGKFNSDLNIGDAAPAWSDLPGTDGRTHSLSELKEKDIVVVVFTCNSCPYAVDYEERIIAFTHRFAGAAGRVSVVAINVNRVPEDLLPAMKERATVKKFPFTYLFDESQLMARKFGATRTPEFFVLNKERKIVYMGAMDDHSDPAMVKVRYLDDAINALLSNANVPVTETAPVGCAVRYARQRVKK